MYRSKKSALPQGELAPRGSSTNEVVLSGVVVKRAGFLRSEEISLLDFLDNEFGNHLKDARALSGISL